MASKPRILLVDDHELVLDGLRGLLNADFDVVATVMEGQAVIPAYESLRPDILLLDVMLPQLNGIEVARKLKVKFPEAKILFLTMQTDMSYVREAFRAGAGGYALKRAAATELIRAIHAVLRGEYFISPAVAEATGAKEFDTRKNPADLFGGELTPRQREVLQLVAEGKTVKEIAAILKISPRTVEFHKSAVSEELGLHTTAELTRYALDHGLVGA